MTEFETRRVAWNDAMQHAERLVISTLLPTVNARWLREKLRASRIHKPLPRLGKPARGWSATKIRAQSQGAAKK